MFKKNVACGSMDSFGFWRVEYQKKFEGKVGLKVEDIGLYWGPA